MLRLKGRRGRAVRLGHFWVPALLLACVLGVAATSSVALAQSLTVSPTRIVLEGRTRSAEVTLINRGTAPVTYRISFKNMRMLEDGSFEDIDVPGPGERFADKMIRYAPRRVVLEPGVTQAVRLLVRKPRDLAPGEYRSHLLFQAIPPPSSGEDIEALELEEGQIRVQIRTIFGISIPVIVRHGKVSASVALSDLSLRPAEMPGEPPLVAFRLNRSGDRSVYGDVAVTFKPNGGGETEVGLIRGLAVYTPNENRTVRVRLRPPDGVELKRGRLDVAYRARVEEGGTVLAEAQLRVP